MATPDWTRDELLLACALTLQNGWRQLSRRDDPRVIELSDLLRRLPLHGNASDDPRFRSPGSVRAKTGNIMTAHPDYASSDTKGGRLTEEVVAEFIDRPEEMLAAAAAIRSGMASGELSVIPPQPDEAGDDEMTTAPEGRLLARWALSRERNRGLRDRKIARARISGHPIRCEVCSFDFASAYGRLGDGYIEVHHVLPLHISGPTQTRLEDLAFLCANCHRMCHRSCEGKSWRTPADLRDEIANSVR